MATMTSRKLWHAGACSAQVALFKELGGDKKEITTKLCVAHASQFDWEWAAQHLLSPEKYAEYNRIEAPASAKYKRIIAQAWAKHRRIEAQASTEYERIVARAKYERIVVQARAKYKRIEAATFWKLYSAQ